ncbi:MAG TPA: four helix bundle protein [bacterium]|nr:four helix bundle protein [bacterium]
MFKFEKLEVWKDSVSLTKEVYKITKDYPKSEQYNLVSQLRRASNSISLNIAEGSVRRTDKDFSYYLVRSLGSLFELVSALRISRDLSYIKSNQYNYLYKSSEILAKRLNSFITKLKSKG